MRISEHPAEFDQAKASAAEALRKADTFVLCIPDGDDTHIWISGKAVELAGSFHDTLYLLFRDACEMYHVPTREMLFYLEGRSAQQSDEGRM